MPKVPTITSPRVDIAPFPGVKQQINATPEAFGADVGRGLQSLGQGASQFGNTLGQIGLEMQRVENETAAEDAINKLQDRTRELLLGEEGYFKQREKNAIDTHQQFTQDYEKLVREMGGTLGRGALELYERKSSVFRNQTLTDMARHRAGETRRWHDSVDDASLNTMIEHAATAPYDDVRIMQSMVTGINTLETAAARNGWDDVVKAQKIVEYRSKVHETVIAARMANDPGGAQAYLNKHRAEITATAEVAFDKALKDDLATLESQRLADQYAGEGLSYGDQLKKARAETEGDVEKKLTAEIRQRQSDEENALRELEINASRDAEEMIEGGTPYHLLPGNVVNAMTPSAQAAMKAFSDFRMQGIDPPPNNLLYLQLKADMYSPDPDVRNKALGTDSREWVGKMSMAQYESLASLQQSQRANASSGGQKGSAVNPSPVDIISAEMYRAGLIKNIASKEWSKKDANRIYQLEQELDARLEKIEAIEGKADSSRVREEARKLVRDQVYVGGGLVRSAKLVPRLAVLPDEKINEGRERERKINALNAEATERGIALSGDQVLDILERDAQGDDSWLEEYGFND